MSIDAWLTLAILAGLFALLIWGRFPTWAVFVGAVGLIVTLDLATEEEAFKGFANTGVLTVVVLYAVAAGMYATGAISIVADRVIGRPGTARQANQRILPATAVGSAFLNNTPLVAMMIPVVQDLGRTMRLATSKMLMQLSGASILGGSATLLGTSTNLIIAGLVLDGLGEELGVFFPARIGLPAAFAGILFLIFFAGRLLPERDDDDEAAERRLYLAEFYLPEDSPLVGSTIGEAGLAEPAGGELVSIRRGDQELTDVAGDERLRAGDELIFAANIEAVATLWTTIGLYSSTPREVTGKEHTHHLVEVVVGGETSYEGRRVGRHLFRELDSELKVVALSRDGVPSARPIREASVTAGDNFVLEVSDEFFESTPLAAGFALTKRLRGYRIQRTDRAWAAGIIVVAMVLLSALGVMSLLNASLLAVAALIATGSLTFRRAFGSVDWRTYVVLAAAVGLEPAVTNSGLADNIADLLSAVAGGNAIVALIVIFIGTVLLTNVISNAAAAALMFPIVIGLATELEVNWEPFVAILMLSASYALINPAGYQTHLMVQEPGGYTFNDFFKVGLPLTIIVGLVAVPLAPLLYGL